MDKWDSLVETKIKEAMEQGEFDNLPGKGRPLDLSENPFEDPDLRMAHRLLHNAGFAPPWIEDRKNIDAQIELARKNLSRAWDLHRKAVLSAKASAKANWQRSVNEFREKVAALNRSIQVHNLKVPAAGFQRRQIDAEAEIKWVITTEKQGEQ